MTEDLCRVSIAKINVELQCDDLLLAAQLRRRYAAFAGSAEPVLRVQVEQKPFAGQKPSRLDGSPDHLAPEPCTFDFEQERLRFSASTCQGEVDLSAENAWLRLEMQAPLDGVEYFLRVIYALLLFEAGGLLLHAAGLVRDGHAYLFFGHSGSGKTTASRLSKNVIVLNDDLVALLPVVDGWMAYATPFWNPTQVAPTPHAAPLAGLYRLVQDRSVWLEQMTPAQAVAELTSSAPVISADAARGERLLARCAQLAGQTGVKRLHFLKDDTFWQVVYTCPRR